MLLLPGDPEDESITKPCLPQITVESKIMGSIQMVIKVE
jgi:hypothetical protein